VTQSLQQLIADLGVIDARLSKVQVEVARAPRSFTITELKGVLSDDTGVVPGDICHVVVLRGRIGALRTDGMWGDITPGTIVEYTVEHGGVISNPPALEGFYAA
jgi:hypothetical protein